MSSVLSIHKKWFHSYSHLVSHLVLCACSLKDRHTREPMINGHVSCFVGAVVAQTAKCGTCTPEVRLNFLGMNRYAWPAPRHFHSTPGDGDEK